MVAPGGDVTGCNGSLDLCGLRLDQVIFPSTHNSMSSPLYPGWLFGEQIPTIAAQLDVRIGTADVPSIRRELGSLPVTRASRVPAPAVAPAEPVRPVTMKAESTGPSSRRMPRATAEPRKFSALNFLRL